MQTVIDKGVPTYDELILVANKSALVYNRLHRCVETVEKATKYLINHPNKR
jgi:putative hydroxymethylpyrimidine transport system substrate-binding protein